jgi:hypothetical protein
MDVAALRADCARCAALCCVALAFDRSEAFAIDKPNGAPCPNLDACGRCAIYAERGRLGFSGCVDYDCLGAGQRVTAELFGGRSWQDEPALLAPMIRAFAIMRQVHELALLLREAGKADLSHEECRTLGQLERSLESKSGWTISRLAAFERSALPGRVRAFLASLRRRFSSR